MRAYDTDNEQREIEFYGGPLDGERKQFVASAIRSVWTYPTPVLDCQYVLVACMDGSVRYVFAPMIETFAG